MRRTLTRRGFLATVAAAGAAAAVRPPRALGHPALQGPRPGPILTRPIPSSAAGERLPLVGLGSWITFNVGDDPAARDACAEVMRAFFAGGGRLIDSSPMYGSSQDTIGDGLAKLGHPPGLFAADKVWISSGAKGPAQIDESLKKWGIPRFSLLEVHNVMSWEEHLPTLFALKKAGKLGYVGVTTSEGRRHDEIEKIMRAQPIDFVQVTYNAADREVEARILPLALERRIAVICNRPFRRGELIARTAKAPLPAFARDVDCENWAQLLLKFIVAHPAVACAIPATSRVDHVKQNVGASYGRLPDEATRQRIAAEVAKL
ncbi:MAG TPA: aldo/keto reductase [Thermoanaerobaculia bacterium]|nr:aldo/keto reductase [Thermoanaerobaculia bacterium]